MLEIFVKLANIRQKSKSQLWFDDPVQSEVKIEAAKIVQGHQIKAVGNFLNKKPLQRPLYHFSWTNAEKPLLKLLKGFFFKASFDLMTLYNFWS